MKETVKKATSNSIKQSLTERNDKYFASVNELKNRISTEEGITNTEKKAIEKEIRRLETLFDNEKPVVIISETSHLGIRIYNEFCDGKTLQDKLCNLEENCKKLSDVWIFDTLKEAEKIADEHGIIVEKLEKIPAYFSSKLSRKLEGPKKYFCQHSEDFVIENPHLKHPFEDNICQITYFATDKEGKDVQVIGTWHEGKQVYIPCNPRGKFLQPLKKAIESGNYYKIAFPYFSCPICGHVFFTSKQEKNENQSVN